MEIDENYLLYILSWLPKNEADKVLQQLPIENVNWCNHCGCYSRPHKHIQDNESINF